MSTLSELARKVSDLERKVNALERKVGIRTQRNPPPRTGTGTIPTTSFSEIEDLQAQINRDKKIAIVCSNMSFFYGIMAEEYKKAHEHVLLVTSGKDTRDYVGDVAKFIFQIALDVGKFAIAIGLNAVAPGAGSAGALALGIIQGVMGPLAEDLLSHRDTISSLGSMETYDNYSDYQRAQNSDFEQNKSEAKGQLIGNTVQITATRLMQAGKWADSIYDPAMDDDEGMVAPFDFFLQMERKLRDFAQKMNAITLKDTTRLERKITRLVATASSEYTGKMRRTGFDRNFLLKPHSDCTSTWEHISADVKRIMRRLAWHNYCRSRWGARHNRYSVTVNMKYLQGNKGVLTGKALNDWSYKVWRPEIVGIHSKLTKKVGWPKFWNRICADFKSPVTSLSTNNHITHAVIHCCQVKRRGTLNGWLLDLELIKNLDQSQSGKMAWTYLYMNINSIHQGTGVPHVAGWTTKEARMMLLYRMRTKGGGDIQIIKMARGKTGKKGVVEDSDDTLRIRKGEPCYVTLYATRKGAHSAQLVVKRVISSRGTMSLSSRADVSHSKNFAPNIIKRSILP